MTSRHSRQRTRWPPGLSSGVRLACPGDSRSAHAQTAAQIETNPLSVHSTVSLGPRYEPWRMGSTSLAEAPRLFTHHAIAVPVIHVDVCGMTGVDGGNAMPRVPPRR